MCNAKQGKAVAQMTPTRKLAFTLKYGFEGFVRELCGLK